MDSSNTLQYLGLSSFVISGVALIVLIARKVLKSRCVRGADGMHLEIAFNTSEMQAIRDDRDLQTMLSQLRGEIQRRQQSPTSSQSSLTTEPRSQIVSAV